MIVAHIVDDHKKPLMCGLGVAVGCKSGHKKRLDARVAIRSD